MSESSSNTGKEKYFQNYSGSFRTRYSWALFSKFKRNCRREEVFFSQHYDTCNLAHFTYSETGVSILVPDLSLEFRVRFL